MGQSDCFCETCGTKVTSRTIYTENKKSLFTTDFAHNKWMLIFSGAWFIWEFFCARLVIIACSLGMSISDIGNSFGIINMIFYSVYISLLLYSSFKRTFIFTSLLAIPIIILGLVGLIDMLLEGKLNDVGSLQKVIDLCLIFLLIAFVFGLRRLLKNKPSKWLVLFFTVPFATLCALLSDGVVFGYMLLGEEISVTGLITNIIVCVVPAIITQVLLLFAENRKKSFR